MRTEDVHNDPRHIGNSIELKLPTFCRFVSIFASITILNPMECTSVTDQLSLRCAHCSRWVASAYLTSPTDAILSLFSLFMNFVCQGKYHLSYRIRKINETTEEKFILKQLIALMQAGDTSAQFASRVTHSAVPFAMTDREYYF